MTAPLLLEGALDLARRGLPVFQCWGVRPSTDGRLVCECGSLKCDRAGKHPHTRYARKGFLDASDKTNCISGWWRHFPTANIGLPTEGMVVLDVDPRHGGDESLKLLEAEHEIPPTWRSLTGGGGEHIFFRAPHGVKISSNASEKLAKGIDVRASGGYVIAPPSLHRSGRRYAWNIDFHPDETPLADAPSWLVSALSAPPPVSKQAAQLDRWLEIVRDGVVEGARNDSLTRLAGHLLRKLRRPFCRGGAIARSQHRAVSAAA